MPHPTEPPYLRPAIGTALVSAFLGLLLTCGFVGLAQRGGSADSFADVFIAGVRTWLVSHGSGITVDDTTINAVPLGAVALAVVLVMWVAGRFLDQPLEEFGPFVAVTAGTYGVIAALLSAATNSGGLSTNMLRSTVVAVLVAAAGAALGVVRKNGGLRTLPFTDNADVRAILRAAWSGLVALLGAGLALFLVMFVLNIDRAGDLWAAIDPGLFGGLSLAVGCLIVIPNLALWATSALLGPGFSLGTDTSVDLTGAHLGAVPGLPLFAALPGPGVFPDWIFILGLLPLLAGGVAGWNLRTTAGRPLLERIALGAAAGAVAGLVCGILIAGSGGAIGPGRMSVAGPPRVMPGLVAIGVLALGGAIGAAVGHYRVVRAHNSPTGRPHFWRRHQSPSAD
ncbi:cell division protein PerM [Aeromicrobium sp.]